MFHRSCAYILLAGVIVVACSCGGGRQPAEPPVVPARPKFTFAVIGDRVGGEADSTVFVECLAEINRLDPDFVVSVGDLVDAEKADKAELPRLWDEFDELTASLGARLYSAPGNDDVPGKWALAEFEKRFGTTPCSFDYGDSHFIFLNTETFNGFGRRNKWFGDDQLRWLAADIEQSRDSAHIFIFCHRAPWIENEQRWRADIVPLLVNLPVTCFAGHYHEYFKRTEDGFACYVTPAAGGNIHAVPQAGHFHGYLVVAVDGADVRVAVVRAGSVLPDDYVLQREIPAAEAAGRLRLDLSPVERSQLRLGRSGITARVSNPAQVTLEGVLAWDSDDTLFRIEPAETAFVLGPRAAQSFEFDVIAPSASVAGMLPACVAEYGYVNAAGITKRYELRRPLVSSAPVFVARLSGLDRGFPSDSAAGPFPVGGPGQVSWGSDYRSGAGDLSANVTLACVGDRLTVCARVSDDVAVSTGEKNRPLRKGDGVFVTAQAANTAGRPLGAPVWVGLRARPDGRGQLYLPSEPPRLGSRIPYLRKDTGGQFGDLPGVVPPRGESAFEVYSQPEPGGYTAVLTCGVPGLAEAEMLFIDVIVCDADESENVETRISLSGRDSSWVDPSGGLLVPVRGITGE